MTDRWPGPVVVAVDGSPHSQIVLETAADQARRADAELVVLHAWDHAQHPGYAGAGKVDGHSAVEAQAALDRVLAAAEPALAGLVVRGEIREGHPERVLREAAGAASLLVLGSRGHRGGVSLGSVTRACAGFGLCPVLVVPSHSPRES
jgi:nucleotide-binding universal stress UspA family protein